MLNSVADRLDLNIIPCMLGFDCQGHPNYNTEIVQDLDLDWSVRN